MKTQKKIITGRMLFVFTFLSISFMILSSFTKPVQANFSGTWNINILKSNFDSVKPDIAPKQIVANKSLSSIELTKTFEHPGSVPNAYSQMFSFDGKPSERMAGGGIERRVTTIAQSKDTLIFNTHGYVDNQGVKWEYTATEWWNLSQDGKALTILRKAILPDRSENYKAVYDKQ
jgi:hypothetical protein